MSAGRKGGYPCRSAVGDLQPHAGGDRVAAWHRGGPGDPRHTFITMNLPRFSIGQSDRYLLLLAIVSYQTQ